jgi:hypothetical protein
VTRMRERAGVVVFQWSTRSGSVVDNCDDDSDDSNSAVDAGFDDDSDDDSFDVDVGAGSDDGNACVDDETGTGNVVCPDWVVDECSLSEMRVFVDWLICLCDRCLAWVRLWSVLGLTTAVSGLVSCGFAARRINNCSRSDGGSNC